MKKYLLSVFVTFILAFGLNATPKYIFYFIGDGMGVGAVSLTQNYARMVLGNDSLLTMMKFPVASLAFTHSANSPVTDSAAGGTALATGYKTKNGMVGMTADSVAVTSIATQLKARGFGVGLITTVSPDDATPASFYAHQPYRGMYYEVGCDCANSGFEFIAGAGLRGLKKSNGESTDLLKVFKQNRVAVVYGLDALNGVKSRKVMLLGVNPVHANEMGYVVDSIAGQMSLKDMTEAGIKHLKKYAPNKFFMMVEGGSIDHAGHANDPSGLVMETIGFDKALKLAYDFYLAHPDETLIVVTADHETGGLSLANRRLHYNIEPKYLQYPQMSKDAFSEMCKSMMRTRMVYTWDDMKRILIERMGLYDKIPVTAEEDAKFKELFQAMLENRAAADEESLYNSYNAFSVELFKHISSVSGIGWSTGDHSAAPVPVFAIGCGAEKFSGIQDNTEIPKKIMSIALGAE